MNLRQLAALREIARQTLNMSRAAQALHMSQPAISRVVQSLEDELGVQLLMRRRNRTLGFTAVGRQVLAEAERALEVTATIRAIAEEARDEKRGRLRLVTTHLHARHTLLDPMEAFIRTHPEIPVQLLAVSDPEAIPAMLSNDDADVGVSTELSSGRPGVTMIRGAAMRRSLIVPAGHPLRSKRRIGIGDIAAHPLLGFGASSRSSQIMTERLQSHLPAGELDFRARVTDTDVIKAYVAKGLGIAVIPSVAFEPERDTGIVARDVTRLFPQSFVAVSLREGAYLRGYLKDFVRLVVPGASLD